MTIKKDTKVKVTRTGPPPIDPKKSYVNTGTEDQMCVTGYHVNRLRQILTWFVIVLTLGLLRLVFHWKPEWMIWATHSECSLADAKVLLLEDMYKQYFVAEIVVMTKEGTRVKVIQTGLFNKQRQKSRARLLLQNPQANESLTNNPETINLEFQDESLVRYFLCKKMKYVWDKKTQEFNVNRGLDENINCSYFQECKGLTYKEQYKQRIKFGTNRIAVHVAPILVILFQQALNPFYIFQVFSCSLWFADEYYYYASTIVFISVVSLGTTIYQTRKMQRALRNTISSSTTVTVCRGNDVYEDVSSEDLVPGDLIEIPRNGCFMQCDAVLLTGNVIVNESMLTGESVPVTKTPIPYARGYSGKDEAFNLKDHGHHTLFCGTHVIQTRYYGSQRVTAVVARTGFSTAKGELVRSILYPKPVDFKFNRDTYYFVGILAGIAGIGFLYTVILMVQRGDDGGEIAKRALDLITIAVPPALPAAMTVGIVFAQRRLKQSAIYCISPRSINVCGSINVVCFDKTGTLTEDGLDFQGVVPAKHGLFDRHHSSMEKVSELSMLVAMAACHSLTIIDGVLSGDPLDLIMFEATQWVLEEPGEEESRFDMMIPTVVTPKQQQQQHHLDDGHNGTKAAVPQVGIIRQFTFSSSLQRMSVIARTLGNNTFDLYCKGAPEMIASLCTKDSVPSNFQEVLMSYTQHGYRVLALAWKPLPSKFNYVKVQRVQRDKVEKGLTFLGLLVMENRLKPETTAVIHKLREADIRTIMVTGDNMLTALSVARECGMINPNDRMVMVNAKMDSVSNGMAREPVLEFIYADNQEQKVKEVITRQSPGDGTMIQIDEDNQRFHFAVMGKTWALIRKYFPDILSKIVVRGAIFARMTPDQKGQLVEVLQELGYYVGMCGDGANDCGALKTAHAGISLSEAEASVASPFTSKQPNIECVPTMIREGRAALVTSFGIFKYMACYSLTQFVSVCLLYWHSNNLTDFEFLYVDLFLITTLGITFGRTAAYSELSREVPPISLLTLSPILSLVIHASINTGFQTASYFYTVSQPWFTPFEKNDELDYMSYENTVVYLVSSFQYITLAVIFSKGAPYRKTLFTNYFFLANLVICIAISTLCVVYPPGFLVSLLELKIPPPITFRLILMGAIGANFLLCLLVEGFFIDSYFIRKHCHNLLEYCLPSSKYEYSSIEQELTDSPDWPPVCSSKSELARAMDSRVEADGMPTEKIHSPSDDDSGDGFDTSNPNSEKSSPFPARSQKHRGTGDSSERNGVLTAHDEDLLPLDNPDTHNPSASVDSANRNPVSSLQIVSENRFSDNFAPSPIPNPAENHTTNL